VKKLGVKINEVRKGRALSIRTSVFTCGSVPRNVNGPSSKHCRSLGCCGYEGTRFALTSGGANQFAVSPRKENSSTDLESSRLHSAVHSGSLTCLWQWLIHYTSIMIHCIILGGLVVSTFRIKAKNKCASFSKTNVCGGQIPINLCSKNRGYFHYTKVPA
jgi:hypothetical protein